MLFNLIGFVSIFILLTPLMLYIYKSMFSNHSIRYEDSYFIEKISKRGATTKNKKRNKTRVAAPKTAAPTKKKVVNQEFTTKNITNPYDLYK